MLHAVISVVADHIADQLAARSIFPNRAGSARYHYASKNGAVLYHVRAISGRDHRHRAEPSSAFCVAGPTSEPSLQSDPRTNILLPGKPDNKWKPASLSDDPATRYVQSGSDFFDGCYIVQVRQCSLSVGCRRFRSRTLRSAHRRRHATMATAKSRELMRSVLYYEKLVPRVHWAPRYRRGQPPIPPTLGQHSVPPRPTFAAHQESHRLPWYSA